MNKKSKLTIIVATHKKCEMPKDEKYIPVLVGATFHDEDEKASFKGYLFDDEGDNISSLNKSYCELTGLYYAWKNIDSEYIGLVHYRRYFSKRIFAGNVIENVYPGEKLEELLDNYKVLVPKKQRYFIETMYSHYAHTHYAVHLDKTREIICNICPEYTDCFDRVMKRRYAHMFNMMIMSKEMLSSYCSWLFPILKRLEEDTSLPDLTGFHGRYYGRVAEIIFDVWLNYQIKAGLLNKGDIKELPLLYIGKVNWGKKIIAFLCAKFLHKKYGESF